MSRLPAGGGGCVGEETPGLLKDSGSGGDDLGSLRFRTSGGHLDRLELVVHRAGWLCTADHTVVLRSKLGGGSFPNAYTYL